jgi:hypothetical protein
MSCGALVVPWGSLGIGDSLIGPKPSRYAYGAWELHC